VRESPLLPLDTIVLVCHGVLMIGVAAFAYSAASSPASGAALALLVLAPLVATLRSLAKSPSARPWAALLLVAYAGGTSVEVVATSGAAYLASIALLAAVLELGLLLALIRRSRAHPRAAHE